MRLCVSVFVSAARTVYILYLEEVLKRVCVCVCVCVCV